LDTSKGFLSTHVLSTYIWSWRGFVTSSSAALISDVSRERHLGTAMGAFGTIFDIGHASGPILVGLLIARLDYLYSLWILSLILLLSLPIFIYHVKSS